MRAIDLHSTRCSICNTEGNASQLYPANFSLQAFNPDIFSARRLPDRLHYRIVKCNVCGLVRSDPVIDSREIEKLYQESFFNYDEEVVNLKKTYGFYLARLTDYNPSKGALLEIGCGNGFFLKEAEEQGYAQVLGVEPSNAAVAKAAPQIKPNIICDIMQPGLFEAGQFDVICLFQVLDHIPEPNILISECYRLLKPQGLVLCITHNIEALSAKMLKDKSPIIDIEHTYLYSPSTISRIFRLNNYRIKDSGAVLNRYSLYYLVRLMPLPVLLKRLLLVLLEKNPLRRLWITLPLGNLYLIAQKP